ncbi:DUF4367 domain-containing protein [Paenibacillus azoreducens]|uniref:DUF4367 domain-containing protein n=1 Tax=Paenibacillus azoreducens TaxID=116718 RepID=A0A920CV78_9BACL|nr:DUF4367 domain-containing protein [Paenibacillus azoreducens]GIO51129.1 hypothetical protein J34TS1_58940 [Paenibacillus azoreducens]
MNMDKDRDLKKLFNDPRIPDADLTGKVMRILHTEPKKKERFFVKYKVALTAVVGMMLMASTGYAAVQYNSLSNKDGEVVYETKSAKEMGTESNEDRKHGEEFYALKEKVLKSGEAGLFYLVANNPNHKTDLGTKMMPFQNLTQLRDKITDKSVKIPDSVNGNYTFKQADVMFRNAQEVNPPSPEEKKALAEKLRKQAEESKQGYAMMPVEMTNQFFILHATYQNGEDEIGVTVTNVSGKDKNAGLYIDEEVEFKQEKVQVKGVEMLYTDWGRSKTHDLRWVYQSPDKKVKYVYDISGDIDKVSKEALMKIAESYLE